MQSKLSPCVSICVPTYNGREHLAGCLSSIKAQTFTDFEVLICDDLSSDGTLDLARQFAGDDPRFRFVANPRRFGLVGNWNNCINQARGEWIKFVFQDDLIAPNCIEKLLQACKTHGKHFSFCARDFIFHADTTEESRHWFAFHKQRLNSDYLASPVINPKKVIPIAAREPTINLVGEPIVTLINQSVFREFGKFDEALIQLCDAEFWTRVMIKQDVVYIPESLASFRVHAKATTVLNMNKRIYRFGVLDPLVIRYRFAFGRHFKGVRDPELTGKSIFNLRMEVALQSAEAMNQAIESDISKQVCTFGTIAEWESVTSHCAGLKALAFLGLLLNCYHRMKVAIARRIKS